MLSIQHLFRVITRHIDSSSHGSSDALSIVQLSKSSIARDNMESWTPSDLLEFTQRWKDQSLAEAEEKRSWFTVRMSRTEWTRFWEDLAQDRPVMAFFMANIGYDFDTANGLLTIRQPGATHLEFVDMLLRDFLSGLEHWKNATTALSEVKGERRRCVRLGSAYARQPDISFWYANHKHPLVVVEVAYGPKSSDLQSLAESYIIDSKHEIRCVIGIDLGYLSTGNSEEPPPRSTGPTVSIWIPDSEIDDAGEDVGICMKLVDSVPFRNEDGHALEGQLEIPCSFFLPGGVIAATGDDDCAISITFADLSEYLNNAKAKERTNIDPSVPRPTKWQKRTRVYREPPPENHRPAKRMRLDD